MKLIPLKSKIAVIKLKNKLETESGIALIRSTGEVDKAKVISIGPDVTTVSENDILLIDWNKASMTKIGDNPIYLINEDDVVAVYE